MLTIAIAFGLIAATAYAQDEPVVAVSRTDKNQVTLIGLAPEEHEIKTIPLACKGPFGLAFSQARDWLYAACWNHSQIALIDLKNLHEPKIFTGAKLPAWIRRRDGTDEMWISNEGAGKVTIYKAGTSTIAGEISTGTGPSDILFSHNGKKAWVSNETSGTLSFIDAERRQKIRDIAVGKIPQGMALTSKKDQILVANFGSDTVSIIDTASAREVAQISVCQGPVDVAAILDLGYVSCFKDGSVSVIDVNRRQEIQRIPVGRKPFGIVANPGTGRVYVCVGGANELVVIQAGKPSRIIRRMSLDGNPLRIAIAP